MTFGIGMGAGTRALFAAQLGMQTAGNNVANANTAGYSRQRVDLTSSLPFGLGNLQLGTGVDVRGITRIVDDGLERRLQMQLGMVGAAELDQSRYSEMESILGEPDEGLSGSYKDLFGALDRLRTRPDDRALRGGLLQTANSLAQSFRVGTQRFTDLADSTFGEVRGLVRKVNQHADAVAQLNAQIVSAESNGSDANDLRDAREQQIKQISKLIDVRALPRNAGSIDLQIGGQLLVAGDRATTFDVTKDTAGHTQVLESRTRTPVAISEGRIAALLRQEDGRLPAITSRIDELARNTILEWNRLHTTGMPASGPFRSISAAYGAEDGDGDGQRGDELLSQSGFPFPVQRGELYVSVTAANGSVERTRIAIDPEAMTLNDVATKINDIANLTATVDPTGRLRISADDGYGFDFSPKLDPNPDSAGTFGGVQPSIGSNSAEPYNLATQAFPVSFTVTTGTAAAPVSRTVTLDASDFANVAQATGDELAAAINADLGTTGTASVVGGRLVIQSSQGSATSLLTLANVGAGSVLTQLGLSTVTAAGRDSALSVSVEGTYNGSTNERFSFVPESDGVIGQTRNLRVRVLDAKGQLVTTLSVGDGYQPGKPLDLGNGIKVKLGAGTISATNGQTFAVEALADSDTADLLVATGTNAFFLGSNASDITVNPELSTNPDRLAAGLGSASGDSGNLVRMSALRQRKLNELDSNTLEDFYADIVGDVGFQTAAASTTLNSQQSILGRLQADRDAVSGVNIDEELLDIQRFQQSYQAAARFLAVAQEMTDTLINLGR